MPDSDYAAFFRMVAKASGEAALPHFRQAPDVVNKVDGGFDPVTLADKAAERSIRSLVKFHYPAHGIKGEEYGAEAGDGIHCWVIDPIDGTRAFISGLPVWGTLVGLTENGDAVAGMMAQPFTGELYYGIRGSGSFLEHAGDRTQLKTSGLTNLSEATLFTTTPALFKGAKRERYDQLEASVRLARYGTDCYAFAMVAAGHADIAIESGVQDYDVAGLIPVIEEAGGMFTTWDGGPAEGGGDVIAAATPELHEAACRIMRG